MELKLIGVARASLEELLLDYRDFLRQRDLPRWPKDHPTAQQICKLAYAENRSDLTYRTYVEERPHKVAANTLICLIHQANFLLDCQLRQLEAAFVNEGGFTERLYRMRSEKRKKQE
ncbi:MAG TPA: four helix bundle suffix domain-containing protein [bacterium]|nr:four helix bundle suffix domain-containing protein [bacterium]